MANGQQDPGSAAQQAATSLDHNAVFSVVSFTYCMYNITQRQPWWRTEYAKGYEINKWGTVD
jgi:hypothetical protein